MTPNCTNTISNMEKGCQEIPQESNFRNSRKLSKAVAIYKTSKPVLSKKYIALKTRSSEKVPHSKSSCLRPIFCQLIKNTLCFW